MRLLCAGGQVVEDAALAWVVLPAKAAAVQERHCLPARQLPSAPQALRAVGAVPPHAPRPRLGRFRRHVRLLCAREQAVKDAALARVVFTAKAAAVQERCGPPRRQSLSAHRRLRAAGAAPARAPQPRLGRLRGRVRLLCACEHVVEDAALPRVVFAAKAAAVQERHCPPTRQPLSAHRGLRAARAAPACAPQPRLGSLRGRVHLFRAHEHVVEDAALPLVVLARHGPRCPEPGSVRWLPPGIYLYQALTHARRLSPPGQGRRGGSAALCSGVFALDLSGSKGADAP